MEKSTRTLYWQIHLENTRLLVKGIKRLHRGYQHKQSKNDLNRDSSWQLSKLRDFVIGEYRDSIQNDDYLAQNPYAELFRFRFPTPDIPGMKTVDSFQLSGMLLLYHQLQILENLPADLLAEAYETLCNSICGILEADMCYLVSRQTTDTRMLCASSIAENGLDEQPTIKELGALLDQVKNNKKFMEPVLGIFLEQNDTDAVESHNTNADTEKEKGKEKEKKKETDSLILSITLYDKASKLRNEQVYLICQRKGKARWSDNIDKTLRLVRDTLFLRGRLAQALARDLTELLTVAREFRSIRRKSPESGPLKILHISDLHVTKSNFEPLINDIRKLKLEDAPFDFLVITGDVVQGRYAARDLEQNYDCAAKVIRALAMRMWGENQDGKRVLRQDWKRRTIVIPGNHDYASMNELETQHGENHRASESGRPAAQEGSAMAKFTYYINFVRKLLNVEIGELIDNGLNELRCYDKMGVAFLCTNTSIMANPSRNNKVHLDKHFVARATWRLSTEKEKPVVVFLAHHGPDYKIDYVADEYLEPFICHEITQRFADALSLGSPLKQKEALRNLKDDMNQLTVSGGDELENDFIQAWLMKNEPGELPSGIKDKVIKRRKNTRLYGQLQFLIEQLEKAEFERDINERYQKIIAEVNRARLLSKKDQQFYNNVFESLNKDLMPAVCLSGHTHLWGEDQGKEDVDHRYVAKRFSWVKTVLKTPGGRELTQERYLNYGVCEIPTKKPFCESDILYHRREEPVTP